MEKLDEGASSADEVRLPISLVFDEVHHFGKFCVQCGKGTRTKAKLDVFEILSAGEWAQKAATNLGLRVIPGANLVKGIAYLAKEKPTFAYCRSCSTRNFLSGLSWFAGLLTVLALGLIAFALYLTDADQSTLGVVAIIASLACLAVAMISVQKSQTVFPVAVYKEKDGLYYYWIAPSFLHSAMQQDLNSDTSEFVGGKHPLLEDKLGPSQ